MPQKAQFKIMDNNQRQKLGNTLTRDSIGPASSGKMPNFPKLSSRQQPIGRQEKPSKVERPSPAANSPKMKPQSVSLSAQQNQRDKCSRCGKIGHWSRECPQIMSCWGCGRENIHIRDCPTCSSRGLPGNEKGRR